MAFKYAICFSLLLVHLSLVLSDPMNFLPFSQRRADRSNIGTRGFGVGRPERSTSYQRRQAGGSPFAPKVPSINLFRPLSTIANGIADETDRVYQDEVRPTMDYYTDQFGQNVVEPAADFIRPTGLGGFLVGGHRLSSKILGDLYDNVHEAGQLGMRTTADVLDAGANYQDQLQDQGDQMLDDTLSHVPDFVDADEFVAETQNQARRGMKQVGRTGRALGKMAEGGMDAGRKELQEADKRAKAALGGPK